MGFAGAGCGARPRLVAALAVAALVVAGCGGGDGGEDQAQTSRTGKVGGKFLVDIDAGSFEPRNITVDAGTTVRWTNRDSQFHTVTKQYGSGLEFNSGEIESDDTFEQEFRAVGVVEYFCELHPDMRGKVTVR